MLRRTLVVLMPVSGSCLTFLHRKPKNARSKRAMESREAKAVEDPRTAVFVKSAHPGEKIMDVMKDLVCYIFLLCLPGNKGTFRWP